MSLSPTTEPKPMTDSDKKTALNQVIHQYLGTPESRFLWFSISHGLEACIKVKAMKAAIKALPDDTPLTENFLKGHLIALFGGEARRKIFQPVLEEIGFRKLFLTYTQEICAQLA